MSQILNPSSGGGGGGDVTIAGDVGSITGSNLTIRSHVAANNSGASVSFNNAGTTSQFNTTDLNRNVWIGTGCGVLGSQTGQNVGVGGFAMASVTDTTSGNNVAIGDSAMFALADGAGSNTCMGAGSLISLLDGANNIAVGFSAGNAYMGSESQNICIGNVGVLGESGAMRLGNSSTTDTYIAGVIEKTIPGGSIVVVNPANDQIGITPGNPMISIPSLQFSGVGTGTRTLMTLDADFIVQTIYILTLNAVGAAGDSQCSVGYNSPVYDNIIPSGINFPANDGEVFNAGLITADLIPSGTTITLIITTPDSTATTLDVKLYLVGFYA